MRLEKVFCMMSIAINALCLDDVGEKQFSVLFGYSFQSLNLMKGDGLLPYVSTSKDGRMEYIETILQKSECKDQ